MQYRYGSTGRAKAPVEEYHAAGDCHRAPPDFDRLRVVIGKRRTSHTTSRSDASLRSAGSRQGTPNNQVDEKRQRQRLLPRSEIRRRRDGTDNTDIVTTLSRRRSFSFRHSRRSVATEHMPVSRQAMPHCGKYHRYEVKDPTARIPGTPYLITEPHSGARCFLELAGRRCCIGCRRILL